MTTKCNLLVVEDKQSEREAMARLLRMEGHNVISAEDPAAALAYVDDGIDLVVSDLRMGDDSGLDLLQHWKKRQPSTPFIIVTAHGEVDSAVTAMKLGAEDYLAKPVNPDELLMLVEKCLVSRRKDETIKQLRSRLDNRLGFEKMIGNSAAMLTVFDQARRAAMVGSTVLITGESGTGKELIAEAIHHNSPRHDGPFVTVNMAAVPENLVESELFGHAKGSFTGAAASRIGRFEAANGGTLFIDEIGDFASASQSKLLRVLENQIITPVGSNDQRQIDARVVAATSRNLEEMAREGDFREDLYYRLNVITILIPPLRNRREDIPLLVEHFLKLLGEANGKSEIVLAPELLRFFETFDWPGNVRQLRNCLESMIVMARENTLTLSDLPATMDVSNSRPHEVAMPVGTTLEALEQTAVEQALEQHGGNRTHAAEALGISVRTLQRKLKAWGINRPALL
jgi:DNA-binding NtrC family response regulator